METEAEKVRVAETEGSRKETGRKRGKNRRRKRKNQRKKDRSKESSRRIGDLG